MSARVFEGVLNTMVTPYELAVRRSDGSLDDLADTLDGLEGHTVRITIEDLKRPEPAHTSDRLDRGGLAADDVLGGHRRGV